MIRSLILRTSAALASAAMAFAFVASPVQAASFTFSDTNCDSFTLNGSVLSCVVSNAPTGCTISGPTAGTINVPITLTAQCATGSATSWLWTGGNCNGLTTQSCSANSSTAATIGYSVTPSNTVGQGNTPTKTVVWSTAAQLAPSGCTLTVDKSSLPIGGGLVVLTAACSGGGAPTSYAWTGNNLPTPTANGQVSTTVTTTTSFSVTPSNATGPGNTANVSVTVAGTALGLCGQYGNVLPITNATWGVQGSWHSQDSGAFGDNAVWVIKLVVPPGTANSINAGSFTTAEFNGPNTPRQLTISPTACDFRPTTDKNGVTGPMVICQDGTSCQLSYSVSVPKTFGGIAGLTAGQTYYINVRNWSNYPAPASYDCGQNSCNAIMNHQPAFP